MKTTTLLITLTTHLSISVTIAFLSQQISKHTIPVYSQTSASRVPPLTLSCGVQVQLVGNGHHVDEKVQLRHLRGGRK